MSAKNTSQVTDPLSFYLDTSDRAAWKAVGGLVLAAGNSARDAGLDDQLIELVNLRISQINGCAYCLDVHTRKAVAAELGDQRRGLVSAWRESDIYSDMEKAALELAEAVTELPGLDDLHVAQLMSFAALTPEQYSAVQWLAIVMNTTNRISILSHHPVRPAASDA